MPGLSSISGMPLFSAQRHYARSTEIDIPRASEKAIEVAPAAEPYPARDMWTASTSIQFETLVMENSDDVVVEGKFKI